MRLEAANRVDYRWRALNGVSETDRAGLLDQAGFTHQG
jgi:hypothetical protein